MNSAPIQVRTLQPSEYAAQFQLGVQVFAENPSTEGKLSWQELILSAPEFRPDVVRGAFQGQTYVGGYMLIPWVMRVGVARIPTGCIGAVATDPAHRHQGVASALMYDAISIAQTRHEPLLLLDGIAKFYQRFGYTNALSLSWLDINLAAILAQPASPYAVRPATPEDAPALLALYEQTFGGYVGSFERSLEQQQHRQLHRNKQSPQLVATTPTGQVAGYLVLEEQRPGTLANEVMAYDWEALLALLQHHAHLNASEKPAALRYRLPPSSVLHHWLVDHLEVPDTSQWDRAADEWAVRSQTMYHRNAGWMARLVDLPSLLLTLLPELRRRWQTALADCNGALRFQVGEQAGTLNISGSEVQLHEGSEQTATIRLTPQAFTQLIFGYRSSDQLLERGEQEELSEQTRAVLRLLFPPVQAWITASDWF